MRRPPKRFTKIQSTTRVEDENLKKPSSSRRRLRGAELETRLRLSVNGIWFLPAISNAENNPVLVSGAIYRKSATLIVGAECDRCHIICRNNAYRSPDRWPPESEN